MNIPNGKLPRIPIINDHTLPSFLDSKRLERNDSKSTTRLRLFSGTANPALAQVFVCFFMVTFCLVCLARVRWFLLIEVRVLRISDIYALICFHAAVRRSLELL